MTAAVTEPVRVRFAPSPTGPFHIGGARTALFNWIFARKHKGVFILRIENTDPERSRAEYTIEIIRELSWLGIDWQEGVFAEGEGDGAHLVSRGPYAPYLQSERREIYRRYLKKLLEEKKAYICYCTKEELEARRDALLAQGLPAVYGGSCRNLKSAPEGRAPQLIRIKAPQGPVEFHDGIRGNVSFDATLIGDFPLAKDVYSPLYNFSAAVDDEEMKISHVIRGEDHISNTPKQIIIQHALGFREPHYAHLPLILAPDRSKLSKRHSPVSLSRYRAMGYLPEAFMNFLALLGWHPRDEKEVFSPTELAEAFELSRVQKAGAIFNEEKLAWLNAQHLRALSADTLAERVMPLLVAHGIETSETFLKKVIRVERERAGTLNDFLSLSGFFFAMPEYEPALLVWKKDTPERAKDALIETCAAFEGSPHEEFDEARLRALLTPLIERYGNGTVLWPLRVAVSGQAASPDPFQIIEILGKKETLARIRIAINKFGLTI